MKYIRHSLVLFAISLFLNFAGFGANIKDKKDTTNNRKIIQQLDSIRQQLVNPPAVTGKPHLPPLYIPKVTCIDSLVKIRGGKHAAFGDYLFLNVDNLEALMALSDSINGKKKDTMGDVILYINGNAMRDLGVINIDRNERELGFKLDRHSKYLIKFSPEFKYLWSRVPYSISVGFKNGMMLPVDPSVKPFEIEYISRNSLALSLLFLVTIIIVFVVLAAKTNLIRIGDNHSPFSLALTQLSFWSIVIASSFIYIWIVTEELPPITGSTLILLSVSALTTAGSRLVDIRTDTKTSNSYRSDSFMEDILQDELGYSVHRAQMFMWTVIMGIIFVTSVIRFQQIPQLDESLLGLMGISSGAYVGLKTMENKPAAEPKT